MTDLVFYIKGSKQADMDRIAWPSATKVIPVYEGDPSTLYSALASNLRDTNGRILPNFLSRYARGITPGRIAFAGFSAAHGFLNPLLAQAEDRAAISAVLLMDATFDGFGAKHGKSGYVAFGKEAAAGRKLLFTSTANTATWDPVNHRATHLTGSESFRLVWDDVAAATGKSASEADVRPPLPAPVGGAYRMGNLFWYRYVNPDSTSQIDHVHQEGLAGEAMAAYLAPYWAGQLGGFPWGLAAVLGAVATATGWTLGRRRR